MDREIPYQNRLMQKITELIPGSFCIRNNPKEVQGIPDLLVLCGPYWAMLEVKMSEKAPVRPNQPYYVEMFSEMGFSAFIYPENEDRVINALQHAFGVGR